MTRLAWLLLGAFCLLVGVFVYLARNDPPDPCEQRGGVLVYAFKGGYRCVPTMGRP